ncbi:PAS domain S-box protein [Parafilimonas sp.]|uniref:PAS domain S-box protein n=1 Tax=Parafilimonas sp. TaxID=1969739 RepID=UPI003F820D92
MIGKKIYSTTFRMLSDASLILKPDPPSFTIVDVNDACLHLVNSSRENLIDKDFFEIFPIDPYENTTGWNDAFNEVLLKKSAVRSLPKKYKSQPAETEAWNIKYLEANNTPVFNEEGVVEYIVCTLEDKTEAAMYSDLMDKTLHAANIGTWQIKQPGQTLTCSQGLLDIFEADAAFQPGINEWLNFFENEKNRERIKLALKKLEENGGTFCDTLPIISAKGNKKWLLVTGKADVSEDASVHIYGIMQDVTESKSLAETDKLERSILALNEARELPVSDILSEYLKGIESLYPGLYCSIHKIQDRRLLRWSAPSLPQSYLDAINYIPIGENTGSCGTAAYFKKPVYISDIANAPEWEDYAYLALALGFKACWSYPVIDSGDNVIAVLGMYYKQVRQPGDKERTIIERAVKLLQLILENALKSEQLTKANKMMNRVQELARFGSWQWNVETNELQWSDVLYDIYGVDAKLYFPSTENFLAALLEEDRQKVINTLQHIQQSGEGAVFEERIKRPNGEIRYLKSWARLIDNSDDATTKMIGACLDITEIKVAEMDLQNLYAQQELHLIQITESEKKYSDLFHLSPQPIWVCDPDTNKIIDVNAAAIDLYGYTHSEFTSLATSAIVVEAPLSQEEGSIALPPHAGLFSKDVILHRKKNGEVIYVVVLCKRIELSGKISQVMIIQDITEKLNYVQAIELQNRKLQEIAWMQSHLVRAPLARIMALADLIQNAPAGDIETNDLLGAINQSAIELDNVLRPIIDKAVQIKFI